MTKTYFLLQSDGKNTGLFSTNAKSYKEAYCKFYAEYGIHADRCFLPKDYKTFGWPGYLNDSIKF
jgi:hypothetical protein